jgi:chorismate dehydratase
MQEKTQNAPILWHRLKSLPYRWFEQIESFNILGESTRLGALCYTERAFQDGNNVNSVRISIVQYLNTAPLVRGFTHGPLRGKYQLSFTVPSQCAEALRYGAVDIAIIPTIELQRIDGLAVLPNLSIASKKSVRSLLLVSKRPIHEVRRIALDRSSRSTQTLVRILCVKLWHITPEFFEANPDLPSMLQNADAALLIGDPALRLALHSEASAKRDAAGDLLFPAEIGGMPDSSPLFIYDIVERWRALTSLPAVLAVWAARTAVVTSEVIRDFQNSFAFGMGHIPEISAEASPELDLPAEKISRYLTGNIDYTLDEENRRGLQRYFDMAAELGLIKEAKPLQIASFEPTPEFVTARRSY